MGRFIGGIFGDTVPSTAPSPGISGVYSAPDHYYIISEGGLGNPGSFTIQTYDVSGSPTAYTEYNNAPVGQVVTLNTAGRYVVTVPPSSANITFTGWAWGGGGGSGGTPGPGGGAAGGGVRGDFTVNAGQVFTCFVGNGHPSTGWWPDGGTGSSTYFTAPGGGSSKIGHTSEGELSHTGPGPTGHNFPTRTYFLIGGGGGGGSDYLTGGTLAGYGGYPSGADGGGFYPTDGSGTTGKGGTQSAGGAGGSAGRQPAGSDGSKYQGGSSGTNGGGGGGGGFYGGGGAGGYYSHGGGGSSYIHPSITSSGSFDASPGTTSPTVGFDKAAPDPSNPGIKPATGGNGRQPGIIVLKLTSTS